MAERFRAYVYDCCGATKTSLCSNPLATYVKERLSLSIKKVFFVHFEQSPFQ